MRPTVKTWAYKKCAHHRAKLFADILNALVQLANILLDMLECNQ